MPRHRSLLVFVVLISHCFVKPYFLSFRKWSSTVHHNAGQRQITRLYSSDDDLKSLYEKAQIDDAEWLQRVLGERPVKATTSDVGTNSRPNDENRRVSSRTAAENIPVPAASFKNSAKSVMSDDMKALSSLGYSSADIAIMKESVVRIILESSVNRPRKGLPQSWIEESNDERRDNSRNSNREISSSSRRTSSDNARDERRDPSSQSEEMRRDSPRASRDSESRQQRRFKEDEGSRFGLDDEVAVKGSNIGEAFVWSGSPPTEDELENSKRVRLEARDKGSGNGARATTQQNQKIDKSDWDDEKDEDSPSPFWPDVEEFKDMLLDESEWRSGLIGDWSVPFIREETKWRYKLYKNWLNFLDEGLGDGFDVVADEFNEYNDRDERDCDGRDREFREREEGGSIGRSGSQVDPTQDRVPSRPSSTSMQRRSEEERRELSKAEKYDNWVKQRVGASGVWTDLEEEEWEASKEKRDAAERKRREEAYNDFKYEEKRRRSAKENQEDLRRRVDFDVEEDDTPVSSYKSDEAFRNAWKASAERKPSPDYEQ